MAMHANTLAGKRVLIAEDEPVIAMDHAALLPRPAPRSSRPAQPCKARWTTCAKGRSTSP